MALSDREKVVIDAEDVPGHRHLWLTADMPPFPWPAAMNPREGP